MISFYKRALEKHYWCASWDGNDNFYDIPVQVAFS